MLQRSHFSKQKWLLQNSEIGSQATYLHEISLYKIIPYEELEKIVKRFEKQTSNTIAWPCSNFKLRKNRFMNIYITASSNS